MITLEKYMEKYIILAKKRYKKNSMQVVELENIVTGRKKNSLDGSCYIE